MRVDSYTIYIHDKVKIFFSKQDFRDYSLGLVKGRELTKVLSNYGNVKNSGLVIPLKKWLLCRFVIFFSNFICQKVENLNLTIASCPKEYQDHSKQKTQESTCIAEVQEMISEALAV